MILGAAANLAGQAGGAQVARPNMLGALLPFVLVCVVYGLFRLGEIPPRTGRLPAPR